MLRIIPGRGVDVKRMSSFQVLLTADADYPIVTPNGAGRPVHLPQHQALFRRVISGLSADL